MRALIAIVGTSTFAAVLALAASTSGSAPRAEAGSADPRSVVRATADPLVTTIVAPRTAYGRIVADDLVDRTRRVARGLALPIAGIALPTDEQLLPNAARDFRAGWHEGIDFPAARGTEVHAVAAGRVLRIDHDFADWSRADEELALSGAVELGYTPSETLDRIRGRQV